tara:strand:+ start:805 stop:1359 length:555 start_codon:yes stop_codon:yes gene_type:complete
MKLMDFESYSYQLTTKLRPILAKPKGILIEGSIEETLPILKSKLLPKEGLIICVGDVITNILVDNNFNPDLVITDGKTKRELIEHPFQNLKYMSMKTKSPAGIITKNAWTTIKKSLSQLIEGQSIHIEVEGEEDLMVLPLIIEFPIGAKIVYGQPNKGAVIREINQNSKDDSISIINQMIKIIS